MNKSLFSFISILIFFTPILLGSEPIAVKEKSLAEISLEDLMTMEVSFGTFTGIAQSKFPGKITVITAEDIAVTPARNLLDLIEVYVPGATYVMHYQGLRLGMRGILSDQNYSYQLLVNGKNMNLKAAYGPIFELQDKDLNSIERVEIISGSGSAVYGAGATAGIINIITKKAEESGLKLRLKEDLQYRYSTRSVEYSEDRDSYKWYFYGSMSKSRGLEDTKFWYIDRAHNIADNQPYGWGYMAPGWGNYGYGSDAANYLGDYLDSPEIKLHVDLQKGENFNIWARYGTYNHTLNTQETYSAEGDNFSGHLGKYFASEVSYKLHFKPGFTWSNKLGFDSANFRVIQLKPGADLPFNHIAQLEDSYSENEVNLHTLLNYSLNESYKFALGGEVSYDYYRPEWGRDDDSFIFSMQAPIRYAVLDSSSAFYKHNNYDDIPYNDATIIDKDIDGMMYSAFGEANLNFGKRLQALISIRADKHEYSDMALSPRLALISEFNNSDIIDLILSKSVRMPSFSDLFAQDYLGGDAAKPEVVTGAEVIYKHKYKANFIFSLSSYFYSVEQISWIDEIQFSDKVGTFDLLGFEPEVRYQNENLSIGGNYSFIKQLDWEPESDMVAWIAGLDGEEIALRNNGENRINNLPENAIKIFGNYKMQPKIIVHLDGRIMWGYQQQDMLDKFEEAHAEYGNPETINILDEIIEDLHEHGYAKPSFTTNASISWRALPYKNEIYLKLYAMNLISYNHLRYVIQFWETGNLQQYPRQCGFIEEPLTIGLNLEFCF